MWLDKNKEFHSTKLTEKLVPTPAQQEYYKTNYKTS
jgi:hypothetical protein